eukprot:scaffold279364_cov39-Attheya_sp.AAC.1
MDIGSVRPCCRSRKDPVAGAIVHRLMDARCERIYRKTYGASLIPRKTRTKNLIGRRSCREKVTSFNCVIRIKDVIGKSYCRSKAQDKLSPSFRSNSVKYYIHRRKNQKQVDMGLVDESGLSLESLVQWEYQKGN